MKILNHRLHKDDGSPVPFMSTPNMSGALKPEYLIMHYTAGRNIQQSVSWMRNSDSRASVHVVIGRDGSIIQMVPFDRIAWHCGISSWAGRTGLNRYSIGIELDNAGRLTLQGNRWRSWFGQEYDDDVVFESTHKHDSQLCGWHIYTAPQIEAAISVASVLVNHYQLKEILGHEDISPRRKSDPGPAFPMQSFCSRILGRGENADDLFETVAVLNIRSGPGTQFETIQGGPLPQGVRLVILDRQGSWCLADVQGSINGVMDMQGWVHERFVRRVT